MEHTYSREFYAANKIGSAKSASSILSLIIQLFSPRSYLDLGCGIAPWILEAQRQGIHDVLGIDGAWARELVVISAGHFMPHTLSEPLDLGRRFDVVSSLEVAEHLDEVYADMHVQSLTRHGDIVLFSAAVPRQGGAHHVNEQWPPYWAKKFAAVDFACFDIVRQRVWEDANVEPWYCQNTFIYISQARSDLMEIARAATSPAFPLRAIHPRLWEARLSELESNNTIRQDLALIRRAFTRLVKSVPRRLLRDK